MENVIIAVDHVNFRYRTELVLENITLSVHKGDFLGLIGPNGSGKTTLLKIMIGLLKPTKGKVMIFNQSPSVFSDWPKIGYVPQKAGLLTIRFPLTVEEVVGMSGGDATHITRALIAVGMEEKKKVLLTELSGGQQQRVFIARALVSKPELLILDEPTVGVDFDSQAKLYKLLRELNQKLQLTLILVSHDMGIITHEVKTIACINKSLLCQGTAQEILQGNFIEKLYGKHARFVKHAH